MSYRSDLKKIMISIQPLSSIGGLRPRSLLQFRRLLPMAIQPLSSIGGLRRHKQPYQQHINDFYSALIQHRRIATALFKVKGKI